MRIDTGQHLRIDQRMKLRREKRPAFSEGAGVVGCDVPPEAALSLASAMRFTDKLMRLN